MIHCPTIIPWWIDASFFFGTLPGTGEIPVSGAGLMREKHLDPIKRRCQYPRALPGCSPEQVYGGSKGHISSSSDSTGRIILTGQKKRSFSEQLDIANNLILPASLYSHGYYVNPRLFR